MKRKITIIFMLLVAISSFLCGCENDTNRDNDKNAETTQKQPEGLKTGVYYLDANVMNSCIVLTENKLIFFTEKKIYSGKIYDYTKEQNTIFAKNSYSEIEISVSGDNLTYENNVYTFKHENDWFSEKYSVEEVISDPYIYYYSLTDEDINSAIQIATEYYKELIFVKDLISVEIDDNVERYPEEAFISEDYILEPGNVILLKVITMTTSEDDYIFEDHRYITLTRVAPDSEWTVEHEGR